MENKIIKDSIRCLSCGVFLSMKRSNDTKVGSNWRCMNSFCNKYQTTVSLMSECFLDKFNNKPRKIIKTLIHLSKGISIAKIFLIDSLREYFFNSLFFFL